MDDSRARKEVLLPWLPRGRRDFGVVQVGPGRRIGIDPRYYIVVGRSLIIKQMSTKRGMN